MPFTAEIGFAMFDVALLLMAAFLAGTLNAMAGGGSFLTFPALVFVGVPPIPANATSAVALFPGYLSGALGFMKKLNGFGLKPLLILILLAIIGGVAGAFLLLLTPSETFKAAVPYLLLFATVVFAFGDNIARCLEVKGKQRKSEDWCLTLLVSIYGGYFNGGLGIVLLSLFSVLGYRDINLMNGLKNILSFIIASASILTFAIAGIIHWHWAVIMMIAATLGGYFGAVVAQRMPTSVMRRFIIIVGLSMSIAFYMS